MRVVTLGSLGAVAPIIPAGAPQYYGIGTTAGEAASTIDPNKSMFIGGFVGFILGLGAGHFFFRK